MEKCVKITNYDKWFIYSFQIYPFIYLSFLSFLIYTFQGTYIAVSDHLSIVHFTDVYSISLCSSG